MTTSIAVEKMSWNKPDMLFIFFYIYNWLYWFLVQWCIRKEKVGYYVYMDKDFFKQF